MPKEHEKRVKWCSGGDNIRRYYQASHRRDRQQEKRCFVAKAGPKVRKSGGFEG
jgi:hypothetical protein